MANDIRIKRRASSGGVGAPSALLNAELAYNEASNILYYGFGDDGSGNATSVIAIAGTGANVTITGTQTITGDKTFSGVADLTGTFKINNATVTATAVELNYTGDLGTFTGSTIGDNLDLKAALQAVETALEGASSDTADLRTLSGTADGDTDLGTFGGSVITDNTTTKTALGELEAGIEANETHIDNAATLSGVAKDAVNLGTFTGDVIPNSSTVKAALQSLETELENGSGSLTADDNNTAEFSSGTVTVAGGTGLTTSAASANELLVTLDDTAVTAASYGSASNVPTYTVDAQGRLTAAADAAISIVHTQVTDFDAGVQTNRLDQLAAPNGNVSLNSKRITGLADPVNDGDAVNKSYADALSTGLDVKDSVRVATTGNITLNGTQTIDGVSLSAGNRVLVKDQTNGAENGIYDVDSNNWSRSADTDNSPAGEVTSGMFTFVEEGTVSANQGYVLQTSDPITLGSTSLVFVQFSGAGQVTAGAGLTKTGNTVDVETASSSRIVVNANDIDLATVGTAGTYNGLTIDDYGRATAFTSPTTLAGYGITNGQPLDATLTALAGVTVSANKLIYATGADAFSTTNFTAFGRSLVDDTNATGARTTLGLGSMSTQNASSVAITGGSIDNITIDGGTF